MTWICDACGEEITDARHGWIEWIKIGGEEEGQMEARDLRLVHYQSHSGTPRSCQFDQEQEYRRDRGTVSDYPLVDCLKADGLMRLLKLIAEGNLPIDDVLEMIKRLHIPGYEITRQYFDEAIENEVIGETSPPKYPLQFQICSVLEWLQDR